MKITLLCDNLNSWIVPYVKEIEEQLLAKNYKVEVIENYMDLNKGKGWSPLTWQVLEGKDEIPITLFEAVPELDAGPIYLQDTIELDGTELNQQLKHKQGQKTKELILKFVERYPDIKGQEQKGEETYYPRRTPKDSELDINKTINEQFDLLRVLDNERYPAFFYKNGEKYIIKIYKEKGEGNE